MSKWSKPIVVSDSDFGFGSGENMVPTMAQIPSEFKEWRGVGVAQKWIRVVDDMFFKGAKDIRMTVKSPEIDQKLVMRHLKVVLHSYALSHEHKVAGASYLLSLWLDDITYTCLEEV